jgi:hypothetical protein
VIAMQLAYTIRTVALASALAAAALPARAEGDWMLTGFAGIMTDDVWEDAIRFWQAQYLRSGLVGVGIGREVAQRGDFSFGFEGQIVQHFGAQSNFEINLPLTVRYNRPGRLLPAWESAAFGLGISWASEDPATEFARNGAATQVLFYWMAELAFDLPDTDTEFLMRLHHRSDGYGVWEVDSGSNALAIGLRTRF